MQCQIQWEVNRKLKSKLTANNRRIFKISTINFCGGSLARPGYQVVCLICYIVYCTAMAISKQNSKAAARKLLTMLLFLFSPYLFAQTEQNIVDIGENSYFLTEPDIPALFALLDQNRNSFSNRNFEGKWTFLYFGYTYCPDICPTTLQILRQVHADIKNRKDDIQFVFVTVDPERDTPEHLQQYVPFFDPELIGVTGDLSEISRLANSLGVIFGKLSVDKKNYLMGHSGAVLLINPMGHMQGIFGEPHFANDIVNDFAAIEKRTSAVRQ